MTEFARYAKPKPQLYGLTLRFAHLYCTGFQFSDVYIQDMIDVKSLIFRALIGSFSHNSRMKGGRLVPYQLPTISFQLPDFLRA